MCKRSLAVAALLFARLPAQEFASAQVKFEFMVNKVLDVRPGVVMAEIGAGHSINAPLLTPGAFDRILVSDTYHDFTDPSAMLKEISKALKPDGRLFVTELYSNAHKGESRAEQGKYQEISPALLEGELIAAGFVIKGRSNAARIDNDRFRYLVTAEYGDKQPSAPRLTK